MSFIVIWLQFFLQTGNRGEEPCQRPPWDELQISVGYSTLSRSGQRMGLCTKKARLITGSFAKAFRATDY
jgi:hypothetical protein